MELISRAALAVPVHLVSGMVFYSVFGELFIKYAYGSRQNFEKQDRVGSPLHQAFRRSLVSSALGGFVLNLGLIALGSMVSAQTSQDWIVVALLASLFLLGHALAHSFMQGKTTGLLLLDQGYNVLVLPLAALAIRSLAVYI